MRTALTRALELGGFGVDLAANGDEGLSQASERGPDLIVLDVMMPRLDGIMRLPPAARARRRPHPGADADRARRGRRPGRGPGEARADDYLVKPFALEELLAPIRRCCGAPAILDDEEPLAFADLTLDPVGCQVRRGDRELELTRTEYLLLELLLRNPGRVLTREVIFDRVWGYDFGPRSKALDVYIGYLRRKTEAGGEPRLIHTVRAFGYVLRER